MKERKKQAVIIGSSADDGNFNYAYRIGAHIAQRGLILITGGRGGVMHAASKGASNNGGTVVAILPGSEFSEANPYCDIVIPTGIGFARNSVNVLSGDIIISIGGASGTLSELAYAWNYGKKIICCSFTGGWSNIFSGLDQNDIYGCNIAKASSVEEVIEAIDNFIHFK
jgi:hypothetical protein